MRDILIAGLGDSIASGEGNPDRPVALADELVAFVETLDSQPRSAEVAALPAI